MADAPFEVREGQSKVLDPTILDAVDLDVPRDRLLFSIIEQPLHGALMGRPHTNDPAHGGASENPNTGIAMHDFTMDELRNGTTYWLQSVSHSDSAPAMLNVIIEHASQYTAYHMVLYSMFQLSSMD